MVRIPFLRSLLYDSMSAPFNSCTLVGGGDEEIEDIVGDVKYTDSQKSMVSDAVTPHMVAYASDLTDDEKTEEEIMSTGKETYVLGYDSEDSYPQDTHSTTGLEISNGTPTSDDNQPHAIDTSVQCAANLLNRSTTTIQTCLVAHEIYTQTSKTIIQLAEHEGFIKPPDKTTLTTQTSLLSIMENKTVECRIDILDCANNDTFSKGSSFFEKLTEAETPNLLNSTDVSFNYKDDGSSKVAASPSEPYNNETAYEIKSDIGSIVSDNGSDKMIQIIKDDSNINLAEKADQQSYSEDELSPPASDIEPDSLMESSPRKTSDEEVKQFKQRLATNEVMYNNDQPFESDPKFYTTLTPLTEESKHNSASEILDKDDVIFTSSNGMKVKLLSDREEKKIEPVKLPPINSRNRSCPTSPHKNLFASKNKNLTKADTLPCLFDKQAPKDRWEIRSKNLASGESMFISDSRCSSPHRKSLVQLPPIHAEGPHLNNCHKSDSLKNFNETKRKKAETNYYLSQYDFDDQDAISIKEKIEELKQITNERLRCFSASRKSDRRSTSPESSSPDERYIAERSCEATFHELVKGLHSDSWFEVMKTLEEIPNSLEKYWRTISEYRTADLIRKICTHIESPRPQVARTACKTIGILLKNTSYTKKPEFTVAVTSLLVKTGSYCRGVRRAANVALDDIICNVDLTHAVTALCIHGVNHKNALVRSAAARLLVVSCALASGGRDLLRARPPSAVDARRLTLRALAAMLEDKSVDTRKYAERLYSMLRPLTNFEAYYLNDVDVETASKQMKKYDQMLFCGA